MVPGDELTARVEAGLDVLRRHGAELAEGDVYLPAPDHLDRLANRPGEPNRAMHDVLLRSAAADSAAQEMLVEGDARTVGLKQTCDLAQDVGRRLRAGPDLGRLAVGTNRCSRIQRLHRSVTDVARAIFAPENPGSTGHGCFGIAHGPVGEALAALVARDCGELVERAFT